ncbi:fas-activated serine/threonine kinase isoform X4 [Narcine bancroftii]|uniref:fas-activated serine/threonine kinase isoform X4 n=1 Tax=Narcine bancroftii TaxID=1343680 RepID=UPI003831797B
MQRLPVSCFRSLLPRREGVLLLGGLAHLGLSCSLHFFHLACCRAAACPLMSWGMMYATHFHACKPHHAWAAYLEHCPHLHQGRHNGHKQSRHHHRSKKKTWNFIHEKMSYDTFFTMKRLIDRSRSVGEVLRWVTQNPSKISYNHYPIALQKIGQILQQRASGAGEENVHSRMLELEEFQTLCSSIVADCSKFDNFSIVNCLYAVAALEELPKKVDSITPYTMALIAKYIARHRLRESKLLDTIAEFLVKKGDYLDSKVIQKLVFPFSRMNYKPTNASKFFEKLESVLEIKAMNSPLATVNIFMSMFQLGHFPGAILDRVFSATFINNVMNSPYGLIVRRYLSLLDAAIELEYHDYKGPRLEDRYKVMMFDRVLTADEVNRKYSYKGLVAEALRQLLGHQCYKQDEVLPPGYYTDFLLWINGSGAVLHINGTTPNAGTPLCSFLPPPKSTEKPSALHTLANITSLTSDFQRFSPFCPNDTMPKEKREAEHMVGMDFLNRTRVPGSGGSSILSGATVEYNTYYPPSNYYSSLTKEQSLESQESSTLSSPSDSLNQPPATTGSSPAISSNSLFQFPIGKILDEEAETAPQDQEHHLFGNEEPAPSFYDNLAYPEGQGRAGQGEPVPTPLQLSSPRLTDKERGRNNDQVNRIVMSVNDKWHYCHNSNVLVGSRAMRDRHLRLLGYTVLQLPYHELEKLNGIEEVKQYLQKRLMDAQL